MKSDVIQGRGPIRNMTISQTLDCDSALGEARHYDS
jgi:hypothetical protein